VAGSFTVTAVRNLMADKEEVKAAMGDGAICTLNALQPSQHAGTTYGRPGQIPGSVTVAAAHLLDPESNTFLPAEQLRERLAAVGAMDRPVIAYCGGGIAATADALALVMLGHTNVKVYDASLSEWAKDESLPIQAG
jgi:thiosulfate/3-mercaptopyruvate sulfurtransferase